MLSEHLYRTIIKQEKAFQDNDLILTQQKTLKMQSEGKGNSGSGAVNLNVKPQANSPKLQNFINSLYKGQGNPNQIGNGTTMDFIRYEVQTGNPVEGKFHSQKGQEFMNGINKLIYSGTLDAQDVAIAKAIVRDIANSLVGK